ncbi:hypothetical protein FAZ95_38290 [Trinickia violacea]|uniref:Uncharacterized protein n=1 Tax=Trinickia violacea TaxID=2571746 RepID=A0A4P8IZB0_9BURK|nr:hypothetical protein [Trinickia violacea]QCP54712.1 hypothetical protein FAZ95_38290 [Trinickia violacea]
MDPVLITVGLKGAGMLLAIAGGITVARYGFHLYKDGVGAGPGDIAVELGKLKVKARSAGAIVMSTAFVWAWIGSTLSPNLDSHGDEIRVYSLATPEGNVNMQVLAAKISQKDAAADPVVLKGLLARAIVDAKKRQPTGIVQLNGHPASVDLSSIDVTQNPSGNYVLATKVQSLKDTAVVLLEPRVETGKIIFYPTSAEKFEKNPQ